MTPTHAPALTTPRDARDPHALFDGLESLLRDRDALLSRIAEGRELATLTRAMCLTIALSCVVLGAVIGMYHGGVQIVYAALKLPLLALLTCAVCAPVLNGLGHALRRPAEFQRDVALVLSAVALAAVVMASAAPLMLLAIMQGLSYHALSLLLVGIGGAGGAMGVALLGRGLRARSPNAARALGLAMALIAAFVGCQLAWSLRPWLVQPWTGGVELARTQDEVSFADAVAGSLLELQGRTRATREEAP